MVTVVMKSTPTLNTFTMTKVFRGCIIIATGIVCLIIIILQSVPSRNHMKQMILNGATSISKMTMTLSDDNNDILVFDIVEQKKIVQQLIHSIETLRGNDERLVTWDATKYTKKQQNIICPSILPIAFSILMNDKIINKVTIENNNNNSLIFELVQNSIDVAILCITDNPTNREMLAEKSVSSSNSSNKTIYDNIVSLLQVNTISANVAHLIYISTFANVKNHNGYVIANAISALGTIIITLNSSTTLQPPVSIMWSAAAIQNLAASYCTTPNDGRCYWVWKKEKRNTNQNIDPSIDTTTDTTSKKTSNAKSSTYVLKLGSDSGTMIIDGTIVRQQVIQIPNLLETLIKYTCLGPVHGKMTTTSNPYPGMYEKNENILSYNIIPWSTTGALKNLVLDPIIRKTIITEYNTAMSCFCYMSKSKDWLEANKGEGVLHHIRKDSDPCWFNFNDKDSNSSGSNSRRKKKKNNNRNKKQQNILCVDRVFIDRNGNTCELYNDEETLTKEDCSMTDIDETKKYIFAKTQCCQCHGGDLYIGPNEKYVIDD